ncbi:MAG: carboxypeptidase-like regulatory domain-containing protein [Candidatus Obscuribacterales bacterium]|jgi:uncharacterized GH25 family protein|nr:carboxypeptidase-like regulatory domain-containing protein [Candidatus Obscuribacterales bacterium]
MVVTRELSYNLAGSVSNLGLPVNGTSVRLYDYWHQAGALVKHFLTEQITDNKGSFSFDVRKGIYCLELVPSDNTRYARQSIEAIRVTANTSFNIGLHSGSILSGTVRNNNSESLANAELMVFGIEPHVLRVTEPVAADGKFALSLPTGKYYLALKHRDIETSKKEKKLPPFLCPVFQVVELKKDTNSDITLPVLNSFKGTVTNVEGHPMLGVKVVVTSASKPENVFAKEIAMSVETETDKKGGFEFLLQTGLYTLRMEPPADSHLAEKTITSIMIDHDRQKNYILEPGYGLTGIVTHNNKPVSNAAVNAVGKNIDSVSLTNEEGEFHFSLPGGKYEVTVVTQPSSLADVPAVDVSPWKGELTLDHDTSYDIALEQGVLVSGKVLDPNKQARAGVQLSLYATHDGEFDHQAAKRRPLFVGITGDDGGYEFRLQPEKYWLVLNNQASTGHLIHVSEGPYTNDLTIEDVCMLKFEIVSDNDEPIPNCQISYEAYSLKNKPVLDPGEIEEIAPPAFTGDDGRCVLTLPIGIYTIDLHPPEASKYASRLIRQLSVNADIVRRVRLSTKEGMES